MASPQIDQFIDALFFKAGAVIVLCAIGGMVLREGLQWLERRATRFGQERRKRREGDPSLGSRRSSAFDTYGAMNQTAAAGHRRAAPLPLPSSNGGARRQSDAATALEDLNWENFELLAGEIFRRKGFEVEISSGLGADGGKDLTLRQGSEIRLVQCKRLSAENKVSVMEMRQFYGLLVAEKATCGIFMTTGLYSRDAQEFAEGKPIRLLGRAEIEQLMATVARPGENLCNIRDWINDFAAGANVTDPDCPRCRLPMKLRRGPTGRAFWGCSSFPRCRGKRDARTELLRAYS